MTQGHKFKDFARGGFAEISGNPQLVRQLQNAEIPEGPAHGGEGPSATYIDQPKPGM